MRHREIVGEVQEMTAEGLRKEKKSVMSDLIESSTDNPR